MSFAKFMASPYGRATRIIAGVALIGAGIYVQGAWGIVLGVVGAVPLFAGVFDICLFAPLFGAPFSGTKLRTRSDGSTRAGRLGPARDPVLPSR